MAPRLPTIAAPAPRDLLLAQFPPELPADPPQAACSATPANTFVTALELAREEELHLRSAPPS